MDFQEVSTPRYLQHGKTILDLRRSDPLEKLIQSNSDAVGVEHNWCNIATLKSLRGAGSEGRVDTKEPSP